MRERRATCIRSAAIDGQRRDGDRGEFRPSACSTARSTSCAWCRRASRWMARHRIATAHAHPRCSITGTISTATWSAATAGQSIWDWHKLPDWLDPRYTDYARACASIGINGTVLTNVNANAISLTAAVHREGGGAGGRLPPLRHPGLSDGALQRADRDRRAEDRRSARSGGARLVEGQGRRDLPLHSRFRRLPGQGELRRPAGPAGLPAAPMPTAPTCWPTRSPPHGGIVMWRAFVYSSEQPEDRAKQAYSEFVPLDGKFARQRAACR